MEKSYFKRLLASNNGIKLNSRLILFNDYELFFLDTKESIQYKDLDDIYDNNAEVRQIIDETEEFYYEYAGGRGSSSSGGKGTMGGGFNSAGGRAPKTETLLNAELNIGVAKGNSYASVLERFRAKYGTATREYAIEIDADGYVHQHLKGGKHAVAINDFKKAGSTIIHNHPSGGNFSSADLDTFATSKINSIVATSSKAGLNSTYKITKTNHFDSKGFVKAMHSAQWDTKLSYNKGADQWLKKNQKKYGYKYNHTGKFD